MNKYRNALSILENYIFSKEVPLGMVDYLMEQIEILLELIRKEQDKE